VIGIADAVLSAPPRLGDVRVLALDGPSGSGKSTLAAAIATELAGRGTRVSLLPTDDLATWADPASWWLRVRDEVIEPLTRAGPGRYRRMDWVDGIPRPGGWVAVPVPEVLILEGVTAGRRSVRPWLSQLVWVEVAGAARRLELAVGRDGEQIRAELGAWQRFEAGWFAVDRPDEAADWLLRGPGPERLTLHRPARPAPHCSGRSPRP
jgi:hypothetical protein